MEWINTTGGPLICAEKHVAANWRGANGLSTGGVARLTTDYDRACATAEYLEVIRCGAANVLVLGDEPLQSAFVPTDTGLFIARWTYLKSNQDVNLILPASIADASEISDRIAFQIEQGDLKLFDSALQGADVITDSTGAHIAPGLYSVTTEKLELKRIFSFLIHRFVKVEN